MTRFIFLVQLALVTSPIVPIVLVAQSTQSRDTRAFALDLFSQKDYFRAISEFKSIKYYSSDPIVKSRADLWIADSYLRSEKPANATYHLSEILNRQGTDTLTLQYTYLLLAKSYQEQSNYLMGKNAIQQSQPLGLSGMSGLMFTSLLIDEGQIERAEEYLKNFPFDRTDSSIVDGVNQFMDLIETIKAREKKSEWLAAFLSGILPGSGQFYSEHLVDGLNALGMNILFGFGTAMTYRAETETNSGYWGTAAFSTATGMIYYANIQGAYRTARFYNKRTEENQSRRSRKILDSKIVLPGFPPIP